MPTSGEPLLQPDAPGPHGLKTLLLFTRPRDARNGLFFIARWRQELRTARLREEGLLWRLAAPYWRALALKPPNARRISEENKRQENVTFQV